MWEETVNVAEAKKRFSELLGQVAYGKKQVLITKKGKPMARLVPSAEDKDRHLGYASGWLEEDDPFFGVMEEMVEKRSEHTPRVLKKRPSR
ncbi:MAG: type II toxin-antitoxin system prevent-host-death family antitoxin [Deltaproteobacteria bacterium]|nr:type II toxin-antitoxin system prevent-host-death family antitoxin [Deltaproteobacteria bacterium]